VARYVFACFASLVVIRPSPVARGVVWPPG
jgi:hypothetical protein